MVSYINETDFVVENKKLVYPEIVTDGLQLYYDAKGKRDTDYHRDTMLDMSGNKNHGKLHNFAYEKHSGYKDGLVFDYVDDKLVRPTLNLKPNDFTFMLNGNIISFAPDGTVKRVQDGEVIEDKEVAPNAQDLIDRSEYNGNILGDMENIIDGLYKTEVLSGTEIFTDKADADAVVHVDIDGKSYQHAGSGKNLFRTKELKSLNATSWAWAVTAYVYNFKLKPNTKYTLSSNVPTNGDSTQTVLYFNGPVTSSNGVYDGRSNTQTTDSEGNVFIAIPTGRTHTEPLRNGEYWVQLEEGSTATAYEPPAPLPSPDYPIEIHSLNDFDVVSQKSEGGAIDGIQVGGRNLILNSYSLGMTGSDSGNGRSTFEEGVHIITPTNNGNVYNTGVRSSVELVKGEEYTLSFEISTNTNVGVYWYAVTGGGINSGGTIQNTQGEWVRHEFTYTQTRNSFNGRFLFGFHSLIAGSEVKYKNLKLEKGNKATDWTPAPEDIAENDNHPLIDKINLLLSEPLRSVGNVKDRLYRDTDGLWKVERNVAHIILNGNEVWSFSDALANNYQFWTKSFDFVAKNDRDNRNVKSTHFKTSTFNTRSRAGSDYSVWVSESPSELAIMIPKDRESHTDTTKFVTWLSEQNANGSPVEVLCQLMTPTTETLDQELQDKLNNLRSFESSNYVYTVLNKTDILSENLKPTLHAKFLYNNWYKEDRVINNLMIYNRALTNEEMLQNYKTIKRRWGM